MQVGKLTDKGFASLAAFFDVRLEILDFRLEILIAG